MISFAVDPRVEDAVNVSLDSSFDALHEPIIALATDFQALLLAFGSKTLFFYACFPWPVGVGVNRMLIKSEGEVYWYLVKPLTF